MLKKTGSSRWVAATVVIGLAVLVTCGALYASGGEGGHRASVTPEKLWDLLWRTLNFAALLIILIKYLAKPLANGLGARRESIKARFEDLDRQKLEAEKIYKEYERKLSAIEQEVAGIIKSAKEQGEAEKVKIIEEARKSAADLKRQTEMYVQQELAMAKARLREDVAEKAVQLAEQIISKNLQPADHVRMVEGFLGKMQKEDYQKKVVRVQ